MIEFQMDKEEEELLTQVSPTKIKIIGCGGGGSSAVNRMILEGSSTSSKNVEFIVLNTDLQALHVSNANKRIAIGQKITGGLGAGGKPEVGEQAANEDADRIAELVKGADMVIITAGMGGGTGTGSAPIVARLAREAGALTIAVVTTPFEFEASVRMKNAMAGLKKLRENVDSLIVVPNQQIIKINESENKKLSYKQAFTLADEVLCRGVHGIYEIITVPGEPNIDFADVKSVMKGQGQAILGVGEASGENRAINAAQNAISNPLLADSQIDGATKLLINISGSENLMIDEVQEIIDSIKASADKNVALFYGVVQSDDDEDKISVTVIATGFEEADDDEAFEEKTSNSEKGSYLSTALFEQIINGKSLGRSSSSTSTSPVASLFGDEEMNSVTASFTEEETEQINASYEDVIHQATHSTSKGIEPPSGYTAKKNDFTEPAIWRNNLSNLSRDIDLSDD